MIYREAFRHARKLLALQAAEGALKFLAGQNVIEFLVALLEQCAIGQQLVAFRRIDAAEDQQLLFREVEVEDGAFALHGSVAREDGRDVRFVRRLVFGEARVAVDAIDRLLRRRT